MESGKSGSACRYVCFLIWSSLVLSAGLALFAGGFLLHRQVLPDKSVCMESANGNPNRSCNPVPGRYSKAIVIIIDALKYEFAVYNHTWGSRQKLKPYQNRLPALWNLTRGKHGGMLYEFLADPPTTTMQRLKGLTTGSLPTFIDLSSNFASYEIHEDNIIDQLLSVGKRVVFAGDDTWMGLFPGRFTRSYPYPSFDVWDLDTVDRGVSKHLYHELDSPQDWDVFIGHYLGVDHAGHKFGPNHPEMARKLDEMNDVIATVASRMPDDCVLFVMGDHGMTMTGDHGGDSRDEISAALFVYGKGTKEDLNTSQPPYHDTLLNPKSINQVDFVPTFCLLMGIPIPFSNLGQVIKDVVVSAAVKQIQYVKVNVEQVFRYLKTYSAESPLPNSSYADIVTMTEEFRKFRRSNSVVSASGGEAEKLLDMGSRVLEAAKRMCQSAFIEFDLGLMHTGLTLGLIHASLLLVLAAVLGTKAQEASTPEKPKTPSFLRNVINTNFLFNLVMSLGIGTALSLVPAISATPAVSSMNLWTVVKGFSLGCFFSLLAFGFSLLWRVRQPLGEIIAKSNVFNSSIVRTEQTQRINPSGCASDLSRFTHWGLCVFLSLCLVSNSFVVEEAQVINFAVNIILFISLLRPPKQRRISFICAVAVTAGLVRLATIYFRCREEQQGYCEPTDFHKPVGNLSNELSKSYKNWRFFATIMSVLVSVALPYQFLRSCGNLNNDFALSTCVAKFVPPLTGLSLVAHWALQARPSGKFGLLIKGHQNVLAHFVLTATTVSVGLVAAAPNLIYLFNTGSRGPKKGGRRVDRVNEGVQTYYNILKSSWGRRDSAASASEKKFLLYGAGTGISSIFVLLATLFALTSMLIAGDGLCPSICLMFLVSAGYLLITSWLRINEAHNEVRESLANDGVLPPTAVHRPTLVTSGVVGKLYHVPWSTVIGWHILEQFFFYATGHQPTFPTIPWTAAFVGGFNTSEFGASTSDLLSIIASYVVPGVLVGWHTFVSRMWFGFLLPLLLIAPFAVTMMAPLSTEGRQQVPSKPPDPEGGEGSSDETPSGGTDELKRQSDELNSKGEVILLENKEETRSQLFSLCVKYQFLQCLKLLSSMMAAAVLRRHLMIWKIFAPRFIFEGVGMGVSLVAVVVGYSTFARVHNYVSKFYSTVHKLE